MSLVLPQSNDDAGGDEEFAAPLWRLPTLKKLKIYYLTLSI